MAQMVLPPWNKVPELLDPAQSFIKLEQMAAQLGSVLEATELDVATAESCTGGLIAGMITAISGSSSWFDCGFVTYNNGAKCDLLEVRPRVLERYGAVSEFTAREMAWGALRGSEAQLSVAVTGIAGPTGGSSHKPVGTVCMALACRAPDCVMVKTYHFSGDRGAVRAQTVYEALRGLMLLAPCIERDEYGDALELPEGEIYPAMVAAGYHPEPEDIGPRDSDAD